MRRDFEEKLRAFSQAQTQFEAEKRRALEELRATHRQEVEELLNNQQNQSASSTEDQEKLAELHRQEVGREVDVFGKAKTFEWKIIPGFGGDFIQQVT